jgi:hypothetical protein
MSLQLSLFNPTREEAFWQFHREHPEVYAELKRQALALRRAGRTHWSIRNLWEVMRQTFALQSDEEYKLNNNHAPFYSRLLMEREPELAGFFEVRGA